MTIGNVQPVRSFVATALLLLAVAMPAMVSAGCYNSGQWGKLAVLDGTVQQFLDAHGDNTVLTPGSDLYLSSPVSPGGNGRCYVWEITYKNVGSGNVLISSGFVENALAMVTNDCHGNNDDSQGGNWLYSGQHQISLDPNAVSGSVGKEC